MLHLSHSSYYICHILTNETATFFLIEIPRKAGPVKLQQLVYATKVAECGSVAEAACRHFHAFQQ